MNYVRTGDPLADFERYDAEKERELEKLPVCSECGEPIQSEYLYEIVDETYCESCMDGFRKSVDSLIA